ncbi:MAG: biopolymer transporter ExbD [Bacteroidota bacterium]
MGLKRRNKTSAEFSLASMTDVIFLLLIFFVLTSNFVKITESELPESDSKTVAPATVIVEIGRDGKLNFGGVTHTPASLKAALQAKRKEAGDPKDFTITIAAYKDAPFDYVTDVIKIAGEMRAKAILATKPKQS